MEINVVVVVVFTVVVSEQLTNRGRADTAFSKA